MAKAKLRVRQLLMIYSFGDRYSSATGIMFLKRYTNIDNRVWKDILDSCLKNVGGRFLLQCNFNFLKLPISVPVLVVSLFLVIFGKVDK